MNTNKFAFVYTDEIEFQLSVFEYVLKQENMPVLYPPPGYRLNFAKIRSLQEAINELKAELTRRETLGVDR